MNGILVVSESEWVLIFLVFEQQKGFPLLCSADIGNGQRRYFRFPFHAVCKSNSLRLYKIQLLFIVCFQLKIISDNWRRKWNWKSDCVRIGQTWMQNSHCRYWSSGCHDHSQCGEEDACCWCSRLLCKWPTTPVNRSNECSTIQLYYILQCDEFPFNGRPI